MIGPEDLIPALIFAGVLSVVGLAAALLSRSDKKQTRRTRRITDRLGGKKATTADAAPSLLMETSGEGLFGSLEQSLARYIPRPAALRLKLTRAGLALSPGRFATYAAMLGAIGGLGALAVKLSPLLAVAIAIIAGLGLPNVWLAMLTRKRKRRFVALFPEAVELMVRGLKSGIPVTQTIISVGTEVAEPVGSEFRRIADSASLGVSLIDALWEAARRMDVAELRFFVVAVSIQRETGGNLAETLENLADILRKRLQMQLKVKAMSSEARSSAMIIGVLPFAMFGLLLMMNPDYMLKLVTDPRGMTMTGVGLFLMSLGAFVMARMVKFEI